MLKNSLIVKAGLEFSLFSWLENISSSELDLFIETYQFQLKFCWEWFKTHPGVSGQNQRNVERRIIEWYVGDRFRSLP